MSDGDIQDEKQKIQLKLGDIIQLFSSTEELNEEIFIISYIDSEKLILNHPERTQPVVLTIGEDGGFIGVSIEQIALLNRAEKDGYLAQNNLNIGDLLELIFIDDSGSIDKVYGQIDGIEEDMMTLKLHPSGEVVYIDFSYKGIPLELNLRAINIIDVFPTVEEEKTDAKPEEPSVETDVVDVVDVVADDVDADDQVQKQTKQLFIEADQFFLGKDLGEVQQEVQLGDKERRYGLDTQLNDLLEELLSTVPTEDRNPRVLGNINNMIQKFKQLRNKHSVFDDFDNANKKPTDYLMTTPLVKTMMTIKHNLKWIVPVVKMKKQLINIDIEEELLDNIDSSSDLKVLTALDDFINNYYKGESGSSQNKYDQYLRFMNDYFKSHSNIEPTPEKKVIGSIDLNELLENINVVIDTLGDLYSEIAKGTSKDNVELSRSRFKSKIMTGNTDRKQLFKSKMGDTQVNNVPISSGDTLQLSSFIALPQKLISSNDSYLNTQIVDKTNSSTHTDYYNYLRNTTSIVNHYVDVDDDEANSKIKKDIAKHITGNIKAQNNILQIEPSQEFIDALYDLENEDRQRLYIDFLTQFLPSNADIISELSTSKNRKIKNITSIHAFVSEMASFMMSKEDFSHTDAEKAQEIVTKNIAKIKQRLINRGDELNALVQTEVSKKKEATDTEKTKNSIQLLLNNLPLVDVSGENNVDNNLVVINIIKNALENYYNIDNSLTSSETMSKINHFDNGKFLNLSLSYLSLGLHSSLDLNSELNAIERMIDAEIEEKGTTNDCKTVTLAKRYTTLEELNSDNNKFVYYDPQYDETRYDILDIYREQQTTLPSSQFKDFLKNKLIENVGMSDEKAMKEADAMISGKRLIEEGDVALLEISGDKVRYYSRENNEWKRNTSVHYDVQTGSLLCETRKGCYNVKNKCADEDLAEQLIKSSSIQSMVNIFNVKQEKTQKQLQDSLGKAIQLLYYNKDNLVGLEDKQRKQQGYEKKKIANSVLASESDGSVAAIKSPYSKLFQAIMGQEDFIQKQNNLVKFVNQFTYDVNDNYWFLCIKTSQKLVPKFLFKLAKAFVSNDNYFLVREQICSVQGVLSDDGDKWVDRYSGYVIKTVDATGEEGYDGQGYKLHMRETLENNMEAIIQQRQEDINTTLEGKKDGGTLKFKDADFTAPYSDIVLKIVNAIGRSIGLDLHEHKPFIVNNVLRFNQANFTTKEAYDKKATVAKKQKNITLPSFEMAINLNILLLTCCFIILAIQLARPTLNTKKSVPGCFKYFKGFPYEANGDNGAVVYIACVVGKIKNTKSLPWKSLGKTQTSGLVKKLMSKFQKQLLQDKQLLDALDDKRTWTMAHPEEEDDDAITIDKNATLAQWSTFKPSLDVGYDVKAVNPLSEEFKQNMMSDIKKGSKQYTTKINTLIGKIIEQSNFYKNKINDIVADAPMILKNVYQEPYMENCFGNTPLYENDITEYLNSKNELLPLLRDGIERNERILNDLRLIVKSPLMNPHFDTRKTIITEMGDFTEETVYKYFIKQCKFGDSSSLDIVMTRICGSKPYGFDPTMNLKEQISYLKSNGHQYSKETLNELLKITGSRHSINNDDLIQLYDESYFIFQDFIEIFGVISERTPINKYFYDQELNETLNRLFSLSFSPNGYIEEKLFDKLSKDKGALREVKNNLSYSIDTNKQSVVEFIQSQTSATRKQKKNLEEFIMLYDNTEAIGHSHYESSKQLLYLMCVVFPNMIINCADFSNIVLPKHWGLSELHKRDVKVLLLNFYKQFRQFYGEKTEPGEEGMDDIDESQNAVTMFKRVMLLCKQHLKNMYLLFESLPFNTQRTKDGKRFLFDERFYLLFTKYTFIKVINIYVKSALLVNERTVLLQSYERSKIGVNNNGNIKDKRQYDAITEKEINEFMNQQISDEDVVYNDDVSLLGIMNDYLIEIAPLLVKYFNTSTMDYDQIHRKIMSSRENEKNTITRTLKDMSDEEREVQNLFKGHKLESWGKGLTKGLTRYVKENYDEERAAMEKRIGYERKMKSVDVATKMNMEIFMENEEYEDVINEEIENEEYSMDRLGHDDDFGDMDGDEFY